uniref:C-type lectin domain-containing protein n=1 Tax=Haplochromis burtoni TaxID=8153 RepID=A0A3Q2WK27_HAPBU
MDIQPISLLVHYFCIFAGTINGEASFVKVNSTVNWTDAQSHCRDVYTDLATIESTADVNAVRSKAWIGLHDDLENSWRWSLNDSSFYGQGETTFRNWYTNEPNNLNGQQYCVALLSGSPYNGEWDDRDCDDILNFVCYNGKNNYVDLPRYRIHPSLLTTTRNNISF